VTLLLTHSTETPLPELPRPITDYAFFVLRRRDARLVIYGRGLGGWDNLVASYLPESEEHLAVATYEKLERLHLLTCVLTGEWPWRRK